jgi:negative regulator of flagellin synthesis FlgM
MRVSHDSSNPAVSSSSTSRAEQTRKTERGSAGDSAVTKAPSDSSGAAPEISARARDMSKAKELAMSAPDVREEKIAELKKRIAAGTYNVDSHAVADRMVDEHLKTGEWS